MTIISNLVCKNMAWACTAENKFKAAGFEAILSGARTHLPAANALLAEIGATFDSLHTHYSKEGST